ncbi:autophagy protein [Coemansia sp. Benny D115]|nr:autophagy protein [Coemansia sp. Benny D115]
MAEPSTTHHQQRCKRCSRQLHFGEAAWKPAVLGRKPVAIDALLQTLPAERSKDLSALMTSRKTASDLSRFFSQSLRTDTAPRLSNGALARALPNSSSSGAVSGLMRGSTALVMDAVEGRRAMTGSPVSDSAEYASSQSDSFILLSSSQLRINQSGSAPLSTAASMASLTVGAEKQAVAENNSSENLGVTAAGQQAQGDDGLGGTFDAIGILMDRLEEHSALPHPMCEDCAETLLRLLDREVADAQREQEILQGIGRTAAAAAAESNAGQTGDDSTAMLEAELARQEDVERALEETLGVLDEQLETLCRQIADLDAEATALDAQEARVYQQLNDSAHVLETCESEQWALDDRYAQLAAQLTQLQRTNVFNDVFNIAVAEGVASINGFRLGGRSSHGVEWAEINAAWGQALLLLQTAAGRLGYEFLGYRLIPMGSFSRIEVLGESPVSYELFGAGDMYLGRLLFKGRGFDMAMTAYLACLDQLAQLIMGLSPQMRLPYRIEQDRVGGVSIRPQFGQDDLWTRACKNTLLDARWVLAFASSYVHE